MNIIIVFGTQFSGPFTRICIEIYITITITISLEIGYSITCTCNFPDPSISMLPA